MSDFSERISSLTPEKRALLSLRLQQKRNLEKSGGNAIPRRQERGNAPLSYMQQQLWFLNELEPGNPFYNEPVLAGHLVGPLDVEVLQRTLNEILRRHESLRTIFVQMQGKPQQSITAQKIVPFTFVDISSTSQTEQEQYIQSQVEEEALTPFDLTKGPLLRARLLKLRPQEHILLLSRHHITSDAWSSGILLREIGILYESFSKGITSPLPELPIQYADFATWQRERLQGEFLEKQLAYWKQQLGGVAHVLELPTDHPRPPVQSFKGNHQYKLFPTAYVERLQALCRQEKVTLYMLLLAAFEVLLYRYSGQDDFLVGSPVAGRRPETEGLIGFFSNTLALRANLRDNPTFRELLLRTKTTCLDSFSHQDIPLEYIIDMIRPSRDLSRSPLIQVMFVLDNTPAPLLRLADLTLTPLVIESGTSKFDLTLALGESQEGLEATIEYNTEIFESTTIQRMFGHLGVLLDGIMNNIEQRISDLPLLTPSEYEQRASWNNTIADFPRNHCLHELFEEQVQLRPHALAAVCGNQQLTYQQLNQRANQLAHYLRSVGVYPNSVVGICLERSLDLIIALVAIIKAGGAYLPLDPSYPTERLEFMLSDTQVAALITQESLLDCLPYLETQVFCIDRDWINRIEHQSRENLQSGAEPDDLVYIIYTSGSTGRPKGVMLPHRGRVNNFMDFNRRFHVGPQDRVLAISSPSFDMCAYDVFGTLCVGAGIILPEAIHERDLVNWAELMTRHQVTIWHSVPALLDIFVDYLSEFPDHVPYALRLVLLGGDWIPTSLPDRLHALVQDTTVVSMGGATECSMDSTIYVIEQVDPKWKSIPYGYPMANQLCYVLNEALQPTPVGVPGELYLGGIGVAWGYNHNPDLTAQKFIPHPFSHIPGERLYRTGDLVRYQSDGNLELLGRIDDQVKINGVRVELGEIEAACRNLPAIADAIVVAHKDEHTKKRYLVAYVVPAVDILVEETEILRSLADHLPTPMIPTAVIIMEALPLTPNGKVDRRNLPLPIDSRSKLDNTYVAPRTSLERSLAECWSRVLSQEHVGIHDNFFSLGGDSIRTLQVIAMASQKGIRLTTRQIFQYQTIGELALVAETGNVIQAYQGIVSGSVALTPIQHWFFEQDFPNPNHWNQAFLLQSQEALRPEILAEALKQIVQHHDALRLRFSLYGSEWKQQNAEEETHELLWYRDFSQLSLAEQEAHLQEITNAAHTSLNIAQGPLLRVVLIHYGLEQPDQLLIVVHHLAIDGGCWPILLDDLQTSYEQLKGGIQVQLPLKTTSFQQWATYLTTIAQLDEQKQAFSYWNEFPWAQIQPLSRDYSDGTNREAETEHITITMSPEESQLILQQLTDTYHASPQEILLTALAQALAHWQETRVLTINIDNHGRIESNSDIDLSRTVGWFTARYPLPLDLRMTETPIEVLRYVKERIRHIPDQGVSYGLLRYLCQDETIRNTMQHLPTAEVNFNYLGTSDTSQNNQQGLFHIQTSPHGNLHDPRGERPHLLSVDWYIVDKKIQINWQYSPHVYRRETIENVVQHFESALRTLLIVEKKSHLISMTPSDYPLAHMDQVTLDRISEAFEQVENIYPLSPMQYNMLMHTLYQPQPGLYVTQITFPLPGNLQVPLFEQAWQRLVDRHPALRTVFFYEDAQKPLQVVLRHAKVVVNCLDWRNLSEREQKRQFEQLLYEERMKGFDLTKPLLMRLFLVRISDEAYEFIKMAHYISLDAWSDFLLRKELLDLYMALGQEEALPMPRERPYSDFIAWCQQQDLEKGRIFWQQELATYDFSSSGIALQDAVLPQSQEPIFAKQRVRLEETVMLQLQARCKQQQITLNSLAQGVWILLLSAYTGRKDVLLGVTSSGRPATLAGIESMVGLFINTLPVRTRVVTDQSLFEWLRALQDHQVEIRQYEYCSLPQIAQWLSIPSGQNLFESIMVFENYPVDPSLRSFAREETSGPAFLLEDHSLAQTEFPLRVDVSPGRDLTLSISYYPPYIPHQIVTNMLQSLKRVFHKIAEAEELLLVDLLKAAMNEG